MRVGADVAEAAQVLAAGGVVALTGAGMSEEAGIPTFRDPGGIWDRFEPVEFGTWDGLGRLAASRPDDLAAFLAELRRAFGRAGPTAAHRALARLEDAGVVDAVITQNVDGLHQEAGSRRVHEIHGSFLSSRCLRCGHREATSRVALLAGLDRAIVALRSAFVPGLEAALPRCSRCLGPTRPDFVAFGEPLRGFPEAERLARSCRAMLVVGTSGEVYPAASLPDTASAAGARIVVVAVGRTFVRADIHIDGRAGEVLPALAGAILPPS